MPDRNVGKVVDIEIEDQNNLSEKELKKYVEEPDADTVRKQGQRDSEIDYEKTNYYEQYLRSQAELQNYKRRTEQRMQEWRLHAVKEIISQLLPVIDDFDILFKHHSDGSEEICVDGVKMIYTKLLTRLEELGLESIEAEGEEFNPHLHEAVMAEEADSVEEGHVLKVWQRGFMYKDTLLRPAKVITAKAKKDDVNDG